MWLTGLVVLQHVRSFWTRDQTQVSSLACEFFITEPPGKVLDFILKREGIHGSVQFSHSVVSHSLRPHGLQYTRSPCPLPTPGVYSNLCPLSQWCHPTISSSVIPCSSCLRSFPASGSFPMSRLFPSSRRSIGASASASVLSMSIQDWFPLGFISLVFLQAKGLSRVYPNTTVQKYQFFGAQLSL